MKFSLWIESRAVRDAIMGVLDASPDEEADLMDRKTTYFGPEIRKGLKELGVVKNGRGRYADIVQSIDDGITIAELIRKVSEPE